MERFALLTCFTCALTACGDRSADSSSDQTSDGSGSSGDVDCTEPGVCDGTLEMGWSAPGFEPLVGSPAALQLALGGQGLFMFPISLRFDGLEVPGDSEDYDNPALPTMSITFEVEGYDNPDGPFVRFANYPVVSAAFEGGYESEEIPLIIPDEVAADPLPYDGREGHVRITLEAHDGEEVTVEVDVVLITDPWDDRGQEG